MLLFLLFLFPTLVSAVIESQDIPFLADKGLDLFFLSRYYFSFVFLNTLPYFYLFRLIRNKKILTGVSCVRYFYVFLIVFSFTLTGHLPNKSVLLSCFDTNFKETKEFFISLPLRFYVVSFLYWGVFFILLHKAKQNLIKERKDIFLPAVCVLFFTVFSIATQFENNLFRQTADAYETYQHIKKFTVDLNHSSADEKIVVTDKAPSLKRTIVIMIGESESASVFNEHLPQFFDLLGENKRDLILIPKAETTATQTLVVLKHLFLHPAKNDPNKKFNLLNLYRQNGFKTFWLSNHFKQGKRCDDFLYAMTGNVSYRKYYNLYDFNTIFDYGNDFYDEILVEGLKEALADPAEKKIIFLHLYGSHNYFKNRYPDDFRSPLVEQKEKEKYTIAEHYKNAAAYTNTVLVKVLSTLQNQKEPTAAAYFSDHGDDPVNPYARNYNIIKNVPLFFWLSKEYQKQFPTRFKNLSCLQYVYFLNLPYILNKIIGVDITDISAAPEITSCFTKGK